MLRFLCSPFAYLILAFFPAFARSQAPASPPRSSSESGRAYENSPDGLRWQLQDILNAARNNNRSRLESLIRETEISDYPSWFKTTFGEDRGERWAAEYDTNLSENEKKLEDVMIRLGEEDVEFFVRRINNVPTPPRNIDFAIVSSLQRPVDIFFASWKLRSALLSSDSTAVGDFVFVEGKFRWVSAFSPSELQKPPDAEDATPDVAQLPAEQTVLALANGQTALHPGVGGVGYPKCDNLPDPKYTKLARKKRLQGTVLLQATIRADGQLADIQLVRSPDPELTKMAVEGVSKWRCEPARRADGQPVPVLAALEVNFRLVK